MGGFISDFSAGVMEIRVPHIVCNAISITGLIWACLFLYLYVTLPFVFHIDTNKTAVRNCCLYKHIVFILSYSYEAI